MIVLLLHRSTFSCGDSRGTLSMRRASRCSRLGNSSSHSGGTSRSKRRWRGSWRGGLRSRSGCCRGWSRRWYRRSFPLPFPFLPFPFPVLPSPFAALAVPALPCPSLPLPPLRLFHVIQDVPVPPLPGGTARLDPRPPSARLMSPGFFLLPAVTGFVAGRAATARSTLGLHCWPLVLWGPPPSREVASAVVITSGVIPRVLGGRLLLGLGGDALRRRATAVAAEDGEASPTLPVARLRNAGAPLAGEEVPQGLLFCGALRVFALRSLTPLAGTTGGRPAFVLARRRAGLSTWAMAPGPTPAAAGVGWLWSGRGGQVAWDHVRQQVRSDDLVIPRRVGEGIAAVVVGGAAVPPGQARVGRVDGGGG